MQFDSFLRISSIRELIQIKQFASSLNCPQKVMPFYVLNYFNSKNQYLPSNNFVKSMSIYAITINAGCIAFLYLLISYFQMIWHLEVTSFNALAKLILLLANWFKSLFTFLSLWALMCYSRSRSSEPSGHTAWKIIHHVTTVNFLLACRCQAVLLMRCIPALKPVRQIGPPASAFHLGQRPSTALQAIQPQLHSLPIMLHSCLPCAPPTSACLTSSQVC